MVKERLGLTGGSAHVGEGYQRDPEQSKKDRTHSSQPDPSKDGFTGIGNMSIKDIMKMNAKIKAKTKKEETSLADLRKASALSASDKPEDQDEARKIKTQMDYESLISQRKKIKKESRHVSWRDELREINDADPVTEKEAEKKVKEKAVDTANKYAIDIPMETAEKCFRVIELTNTLVEKGNPNSVSDAGVAGEVAFAGVRGGCMNVLINLNGIDDQEYYNKKRTAVEALIKKAESLHQTVFNKTMKQIDD